METSSAKVRLAEVAGRQWGRVTRAQLRELASDCAIHRWLEQGYLHPRLPCVYAVGHAARSEHADLAEALLYAGPGAALSHATAARWLGLIDARPRSIHVSTPRRCLSQPGVVVHERRHFERVWRDGLPITDLPQLLLDLAATEPLRTVRKALAGADYRGWLDVGALEAACGRGRRGSVPLRRALEAHQPALARTRSELEVAFIEFCEEEGLVVPETNQYVAGWEVDAVWHQPRIAVELDGYDNHRSRAQVKRDRRKDLDLRGAGYIPVRYSADQLAHQRAAVRADLLAIGAPRPAAEGAPRPAAEGAPRPAAEGAPRPAAEGAPRPAAVGAPRPAAEGAPTPPAPSAEPGSR